MRIFLLQLFFWSVAVFAMENEKVTIYTIEAEIGRYLWSGKLIQYGTCEQRKKLPALGNRGAMKLELGRQKYELGRQKYKESIKAAIEKVEAFIQKRIEKNKKKLFLPYIAY